MRKVLLTLLALGGAITAGSVHAAPVISPVPLVGTAPEVVPIQYYNDFRYRQHLRRDRFVERQQRREFRHWQRQQHRPYYGYARPGYRQFGYYGPRYY